MFDFEKRRQERQKEKADADKKRAADEQKLVGIALDLSNTIHADIAKNHIAGVDISLKGHEVHLTRGSDRLTIIVRGENTFSLDQHHPGIDSRKQTLRDADLSKVTMMDAVIDWLGGGR